jgi:hypothetical protein
MGIVYKSGVLRRNDMDGSPYWGTGIGAPGMEHRDWGTGIGAPGFEHLEVTYEHKKSTIYKKYQKRNHCIVRKTLIITPTQ